MAAISKFVSTLTTLTAGSNIIIQDLIAADAGNHGATFVPVWTGSDKTTVSVGTGHVEFYPLYAGIGNVHNNVRRAHRNAITLIGFLAIPKSTFISYRSFSNSD